MRRYELGMALTYAKDWGIRDAIREFFQNALDEEKENPSNKMFWEYNRETGTLMIANKHSKLSPASLLMGNTSKEGKEDLIGEHGEGYKVATIVLLRNGKTVKIYNNTENEVWTSRIVRSRRYGVDIGCFDITKDFFNKNYDLVIVIEGISEDEWQETVSASLFLQKGIGEVKESSTGAKILLDDRFRGKIFVEGLYVCEKSFLDWGYNLPANMVKLDRDRGLVDSFDLQWTIGKVIAGVNDANFIAENLDRTDMQYVHYGFKEDPIKDQVSDRVYDNFKAEYGEDAVPASTTEEFNLLSKTGRNTVMVSDRVKSIIEFKERSYEKKGRTIDERFNDWYAEASRYLPRSLCAEIQLIWRKR